MGITAVDVETTGLSPETDRIIEIGAYRPETGAVFRAFINPHRALPAKITELTGITDGMLAEAGEEAQVAADFLAFLGKDRVLLGHNIGFDHGFLTAMLERCGLPVPECSGLDTLKLSRMLCAELPGKSLSAMCAHFGIVNEREHRAFEDAQAAWLLYARLAEQAGWNAAEGGEDRRPSMFAPEPFVCRPRKQEPMTAKQRAYLNAILAYHRIDAKDLAEPTEGLTKSEASRLIDRLLLHYGRIPYRRQ